MDKDKAFDDIAKAIYNLRVAFIKNNMKPPKAIELDTYDDGMRFRQLMPRDLVLSQPDMLAKGMKDPEWVASMMGVEVRMPAQWRSDLKGKRHAV